MRSVYILCNVKCVIRLLMLMLLLLLLLLLLLYCVVMLLYTQNRATMCFVIGCIFSSSLAQYQKQTAQFFVVLLFCFHFPVGTFSISIELYRSVLYDSMAAVLVVVRARARLQYSDQIHIYWMYCLNYNVHVSSQQLNSYSVHSLRNS